MSLFNQELHPKLITTYDMKTESEILNIYKDIQHIFCYNYINCKHISNAHRTSDTRHIDFYKFRKYTVWRTLERNIDYFKHHKPLKPAEEDKEVEEDTDRG